MTTLCLLLSLAIIGHHSALGDVDIEANQGTTTEPEQNLETTTEHNSQNSSTGSSLGARRGFISRTSCPPVCPPGAVYKPLCARCTDGIDRTFRNECKLKIFNCEQITQCVKLHDGPCQVSDEDEDENQECPPWQCPPEQRICAVCKTGPRTFDNKCELERHNFCKPTEKCVYSYDGPCEGNNPPPPKPPECWKECPAVVKYVCAQCAVGSRTTFLNECELGRTNKCDKKQFCVKLRDGECCKQCPVKRRSAFINKGA